MPTLEAASREDNIMKSMDAFIQTQIETGLSATVYYMNQSIPAASLLPARWVVAMLTELGQVGPVLVAGTGQHSAWTELALDLNIYEKAETGLSEVDRYSLSTLGSNIKEVFEVGSIILVYDYDTVGNPQVGGLKVWDPPRLVSVNHPHSLGIRQKTLNVLLRYVSVRTD